MGKKKSKTARKQELEAVDDDIIYLYIDNPYGVGKGADLRKQCAALTDLSNWIYHMLGDPKERAVRSLPDRILAHSGITSVILPVEVPSRDEEKVSHLLGWHDFHKFVDMKKPEMQLKFRDGADMQRATVRISTLQAEDTLLGSRKFIIMHVGQALLGV